MGSITPTCIPRSYDLLPTLQRRPWEQIIGDSVGVSVRQSNSGKPSRKLVYSNANCTFIMNRILYSRYDKYSHVPGYDYTDKEGRFHNSRGRRNEAIACIR